MHDSIRKVIMDDPFYSFMKEGIIHTYNKKGIIELLNSISVTQDEYNNLLFESYEAFNIIVINNLREDYHGYLMNKRLSNFLVYAINTYGIARKEHEKIYVEKRNEKNDNGIMEEHHIIIRE